MTTTTTTTTTTEYELTPYGVHKLVGDVFIPADTYSAAWVEYQEWLAAGNTPTALNPDKYK